MTTIHDFGFRGYEGARTSGLARMFAIARSEIRRMFHSKKFLIFFVLCLAPAIIAFVFVYIRFLIIEGQSQVVGLGGQAGRRMMRGGGPFGRTVGEVDFYFDFLKGGSTLLTVIYSAVIGAGAIARDRSAGALEIYFTRGIKVWQYFVGKLISVCYLLISHVLLPFLVVWLFAVSAAPTDSGFFGKTVAFMPRLVLGQFFLCATLALWLCALSSSTDSTRFALLRWVGALAALRIVGGRLRALFDNPDWMLISPFQVTKRIAAEISGATTSSMSLSGSMLVWLALCAAALLWARLKLRPVAVVG